MRPGSSFLRRAAAGVAAVVLVAACSGEAAPTTTLRETDAASFLTDVAARTPFTDGTYRGTLERGNETSEGRFLAAVRGDDAGGLGLDWSAYTDESLLYLGYLYCLARDNGAPVDAGLGLVVDEVMVHAGAPGAAAGTSEVAAAIVVANYAAGTFCGGFATETREYLESLDD